MHAVGAAAPRWDVRLVPAALTSWLVTAAGIAWPVGGQIALAGVLLSAIAAVLWWRGERLHRPGVRLVAANLAVIALAGVGFGCAVAVRSQAVAHHPITAAFGTAAPVTVTAGESAMSSSGQRMMFRATLQRLDGRQITGRAVVFASSATFGEVVVGQPVAFRARIARPARRDLTVATLTAVGEPTRGRAGLVQRCAHLIRRRFAAGARRVLPDEQARMLPALVLGDTAAITAATDRDFRAAGLTHLMAVSGANVTIVCGAVLFTARWVGPRAAVVLAVVALLVFVIVVQPTASVLRAAAMGAIALLGMLSARRRQALPSLSASILVLLAVAPHLAVDVGFALSAVATAALVVIAPSWSTRLVNGGWPKPLADAACVAWAAQLVTAPLIAGISGRVSLVSTAANLAVTAMIPPITIVGSAAAALCAWWPAAAELLIRFTGPELWWVCRIAQWSAGVPGATIGVPHGAEGVILLTGATALAVLSWRWRWGRLAALAALLCLLSWSLSELFISRTATLSAAHGTIAG